MVGAVAEVTFGGSVSVMVMSWVVVVCVPFAIDAVFVVVFVDVVVVVSVDVVVDDVFVDIVVDPVVVEF